MTRRLLLLGGGHAHVHVLRDLARLPLNDTQAVLVTPFARQFYSGMLPGLVAGHYAADECAIALAPLAQAAGTPLIEAAAVGINSAARHVLLPGGRTLAYDLLSIDTGAVIHRDVIPGARHGLFVRPIEDFVAQLDSRLAGTGPAQRRVVVIGGGAAGVELAMAVLHRLSAGAGAAALMSLVTGGPGLLGGYPAAAQRRVTRALQARGVSVLRQTCTAIEPGHVLLADGSRPACDVAVIATGASAPHWLAGSGLALDEHGFIATRPTLQSLSHPEVFAVGDVASRVDVRQPKSGVHAVRAGPALALNLRRFVDDDTLQPHWPQQRSLNLVSCGDCHAIATWGGWSAEGAWAWRWKDRIDRAFVARYSGPA